MDMKSLIAKMDQLEQVDEETKKKPDEDGDGVPDWADKKDGEDDNEDKEKVDEAIAIQADGQEAMALLDMLKLAGQPAPQQAPDMMVGGCGMAEADRDPSYANTPDEEVADMDAATPSGNDMHREKDAWRAAAGADNPMVAAMEGKLSKMFESMSKELAEEGEWWDDEYNNRPDTPPAPPAWKSKANLAKGPGAKWKQGLTKSGQRYSPNNDQQDTYTDRTDKSQSGEFMNTGDRLGSKLRSMDKKGEIKRDLKHSYPFSKNRIANKLPESEEVAEAPKTNGSLGQNAAKAKLAKQAILAFSTIYDGGDSALEMLNSHSTPTYEKYGAKYNYDVEEMIKKIPLADAKNLVQELQMVADEVSEMGEDF